MTTIIELDRDGAATVTDCATVATSATSAPTTIDDCELERFAWVVARSGLRDRQDVIDRVVDRARPAGVNSVLIDVLADPAEPEVARIRAFGRVALQLGTRPLAA